VETIDNLDIVIRHVMSLARKGYDAEKNQRGIGVSFTLSYARFSSCAQARFLSRSWNVGMFCAQYNSSNLCPRQGAAKLVETSGTIL